MKNLLISLTVISVLSSCGSSGSSGGASGVTNPITLPNLGTSQFSKIPMNIQIGQADCSNISSSSSSQSYLFRTSETEFRVETDIFVTGNCTGNLAKTTFSSLKFLSFAPDVIPDTDLMNLSFQSAEIQFYYQSEVDSNNFMALYGYTDWLVATRKNITCTIILPNGPKVPCAGAPKQSRLKVNEFLKLITLDNKNFAY